MCVCCWMWDYFIFSDTFVVPLYVVCLLNFFFWQKMRGKNIYQQCKGNLYGLTEFFFWNGWIRVKTHRSMLYFIVSSWCILSFCVRVQFLVVCTTLFLRFLLIYVFFYLNKYTHTDFLYRLVQKCIKHAWVILKHHKEWCL